MGERNDLQAALLAEVMEDAFQRWGGDGPHNGIERNAQRGNEGAAQFPVAVVRGEKNCAAFLLANTLNVLQALNADGVADFLFGEFAKANEIGEIFAEGLKGFAGAAGQNLPGGDDALMGENDADVLVHGARTAPVEEVEQVTDAQPDPVGEFQRQKPDQESQRAVQPVGHGAGAASGGMWARTALAMSRAASGLPRARARAAIMSSSVGLVRSEVTTAGKSRSRSRWMAAP